MIRTLGIDIGGSAVKGSIVDTRKGVLTVERHRIALEGGTGPKEITDALRGVVRYFNWKGPVGVGFPAVVRGGEVCTAANIDKAWIGVNVEKAFGKATRCKVFAANDADAAGLAEQRFGAAKGKKGVVLLLTVGTGIGSALFIDGVLVPNTELGHVQFKGMEAERYASAATREKEDLSLKQWARRFNEFLLHVEGLFWPNLIIIGGGISRKHEKFKSEITARTPVVPAKNLNQAGIIGAALVAASRARK